MGVCPNEFILGDLILVLRLLPMRQGVLSCVYEQCSQRMIRTDWVLAAFPASLAEVRGRGIRALEGAVAAITPTGLEAMTWAKVCEKTSLIFKDLTEKAFPSYSNSLRGEHQDIPLHGFTSIQTEIIKKRFQASPVKVFNMRKR